MTTTPTLSASDEITGLFELHFITAAEDTFKLFAFVKDHPHLGIRPRANSALSLHGKHPNQPMFTCWAKGSQTDAKKLTEEISEKIRARGITLRRVKIEAMMSSKNVPTEARDEHYYEFHFKVDVANSAEWNKLVTVITPFGAHLFFNPFSKTATMRPVITLRRYSISADKAMEDLNALVDAIEKAGFKKLEGIEREYSVYDSDVFLDQGWLFQEKPTEFIRTVLPSMLVV
eukprot:TRINITY_DN4247_c0_g2_i3.p1 TRINITY_DN4247_c0_g2~~TRINITY_DN4247_c0_g2_i3.p1  ORF type:complete len:231 (-),score=45.40 TRINITY_DN4247_c0_g2_i3:89-781(-)